MAIPASSTNVVRTFRKTLAALRKAKGWSQDALAAHSGLSRETIAALEQGRQMDKPILKLVAIAQALGVSLDALFGRTPRVPPEAAMAERLVALLLPEIRRAITEGLRAQRKDQRRHLH